MYVCMYVYRMIKKELAIVKLVSKKEKNLLNQFVPVENVAQNFLTTTET